MAARDSGDVTSTGWYDWQTDRDRGMAIGMHYKQMGEEIADHYNQEFNAMYDVNKKVYTDKDWATAWQDYQNRGLDIANYYKSKGAAIDKFYQGKYALEGMDSPMADETVDLTSIANTIGSNANADVLGHNNPDDVAAYIWGLDWKNDREQAMAIHDAMMKKGIAIGEYYRSKYDPTYGLAAGIVPASAQPSVGQDTASDTAAEPTDNVSGSTAAVTTPIMHNPDLDYPPWGVDPAADREHGIAIGQYWKQNGKAIGAAYHKRGMELGTYYENKYRSMFDPTFHNNE